MPPRGSVSLVVALTLALLAAAPSGSSAPAAERQPKLPTGEYLHTFRFEPPAGTRPKSVHVAGEFNGWSRDATPLRRAGDGAYAAQVKLAEGKYQYKFVVDGERWLTDPAGDKSLEVDDTYGGKNSVVIVGFDLRKAPPPQPNDINPEAVRFDPSDPSDVNVFAPGQIRFRVRAQAGDLQSVTVRPADAGSGVTPTALQLAGTQEGLDVFGGVVSLDRPTLRYFIELKDGSRGGWIAGGRVHEATPNDPPGLVPGRGPHVLSVDTAPTFVTPDWAKHAVWYQVFPERFRNGDPSNDPGAHDFERLVDWRSDWWKTQPGETPGDANFYGGAGNVWKRRYGGDLQGVRQALPYLRKLGVTAIYFNPIFEAESMHKYDTADFRHVDDNFGVKGDLSRLTGETDDPSTWQWTQSDRLLLDFMDEARRQGFKVVLDGVFNHVGRAHPFFIDVLERGQQSRYADWFEITDWGDAANWRKLDRPFDVHGKPGGIQWKAWDGPNGHLPVFRKDPKLGLVAGPREHLFAITRRWLAPDGDASRGADGWRLDVPGDIPHPFWVDWRNLVKSVEPDAYVTGEIWPWAQAWLKGDQFDAVMNYQFAMAAQDFFVDRRTAIAPGEFGDRLSRLVYNYPFQVALAQQNLFDSHDTDRLASMFVNPDRPYDAANRIQDNGPDYSPRKPNDEEWRRMKQAAAFQMTFVGAPMIYYGTEAGMWSPDDPSNRQPMVWQDLLPYEDPQVEFRADVFAWYQRLIALRNQTPALRTGFFRTLLADDDRRVFAFERELDGERVIVVLNNASGSTDVAVPAHGFDDGTALVDWLGAGVKVAFDADREPRPKLRASAAMDGPRVTAGKVRVTLPPYGTAVLSKRP